MHDVPADNPVKLRDQFVERLRAVEEQIAGLREERDILQRDLQVTEQFIAVWRRTNNVQGPPERIEAKINLTHNDVPSHSKKPKNPRREAVAEAVLEIISNRGAPVSRSELYEALKARGVAVYGKDPVMVLSTMLWRSQDRIVRLGSEGYWFRNRPYPPANYYPDTADVTGVAHTDPEDGAIEDPDDDPEVTSSED
ncbi:hypothetical protein OKW76_05775 [Sphingomonas sp. S1-29]|uniref:hypothetical protein n=1 Tax=Sphingomonas sp. S1-29 TaxID=2991074 RepID=UPI00223FF9A5|nr:hypothetical protein [Sphingomonas sp. S1-29]UZK70549.1 hypothetical protein OKW76_05775 [Sphingomonas sp. S1-29]